MVANFGPSKFNYDETLTTLRYANRAKNIKNKPRVNEDPKDAMLREFQEEISRLKAQLANVNPKEKRKKSAGGKKKMHSSVDGVGSASSSNLGLEESMEASSMGSSTVSSPTGNLDFFFQNLCEDHVICEVMKLAPNIEIAMEF